MSFIYPPIALLSVRGKIQGTPADYKSNLDAYIQANSYSKEESENVFDWAKFIYESEISRKDTIESKAQSYLIGISISVGIIAAIPLLFSNRWSLPFIVAMIIAGLLTASIVFMITAGYFSLKTRHGDALSLPSSGLFFDQLKENGIGLLKNSSHLILFSRNNEKSLIQKSNFLYVSEMCFVRAIILLLLSVMLAVGAKLYDPIIIANTDSDKVLSSKIDLLEEKIDVMKLTLTDRNEEVENLKKDNAAIYREISDLNGKSNECAERYRALGTRIQEELISIKCMHANQVGVPFRYTPIRPRLMRR